MSTVFVLLGHTARNESDLLGVYSTHRAADLAADDYRSNGQTLYQGCPNGNNAPFSIHEHEIEA